MFGKNLWRSILVVIQLAFVAAFTSACESGESFSNLEEKKALLDSEVKEPQSPLLTRVKSQVLLTEQSFSFDFKNERNGSDEKMEYACIFDTVIDGKVDGNRLCELLPDEPIQKWDEKQGIINWGPVATVGNYEFQVVGKNEFGTDLQVFHIEVKENQAPKLARILDQLIEAEQSFVVRPRNERTNSGSEVTFTCTYDQTLDGKVSAGDSCKKLPGEPANKFDAETGVFNWIPPPAAIGSYEFLITATNEFGKDEKQFVLIVGESSESRISLSYVRDQFIVQGETLNVDVSNTLTNNDEGVNYKCFYDSVADGEVGTALTCDVLPGTPSQKFNPVTGTLIWTPSLQQQTEIEMRITGNKEGDEDSQVFVVSFSTQRFGEVGNSAIRFEPNSWDFGAVSLNNNATPKNVTLTNNSSADVYIGGISSSNPDFTLNWSACPAPPQKLSSLANCVINVGFRPSTSNQLGASLTVSFGRTAQTASEYSSVLGLSGRGVGAMTFNGLQTISNVTHNSLRLNWTATPEAASFLIFQIVSGNMVYLETLVNTGGAVTSKTINNLQPGTAYTYRVRATDYVGVVDSNTANVTATTEANQVPSISSGPASWAVFTGRMASSLDFNDNYSGNDLDRDGDIISYTCRYDNTIDGSVASNASLCTSIVNIDATNVSFNQFTGILSNFKPVSADLGRTYEFRVTATDFYAGSSSTTFSTTVGNGTPTITSVSDAVFPSSYITTASTYSLDFDNIGFSPYSDTDMTYTCVARRLPVSAGATSSCASVLPGTFSLGASSGVLSWTPGSSGAGAYELTVTGTNLVGDHSRTFKVAVIPGISMTGRLLHLDAAFADLTRAGRNAPSFTNAWSDLLAAESDGLLTNFNTATAWEGTGTAASPVALVFDGSDDYVDLNISGSFAGESYVLFDSWIYPGTNTREKAIWSYGEGVDKGLILTNKRFWLGQGGSSYKTVALAKNPALYWDFSSAGIAEDATANDRDGTFTNATVGAVTQISLNVDDATFDLAGNGISFTGTASVRPATLDIGDKWTIASWFYYPFPTSCSSGWCTLTRGSSDHHIIVNNSMALGSFLNSQGNFRSSGYSLQNLQAGWHHIAAVADGDTGAGTSVTRFYIDGSLVGTIPYQSRSDIQYVGNYTSNQSFGSIDEFAVWNSALTDADILQLYQAGARGSCNYTVGSGYWYNISGIADSSGQTLSLYINGVQNCSVSLTGMGSFTASTSNLTLGRSADGQATSWSGKIASLMFYDSGSATTLTNNYSAQSPRFSPLNPLPPAGLRLWLRADQGTYQDIDGSDPASDQDDFVGLWQDLSGNLGHLTSDMSGAAERRPKIKTNALNGHPVVVFDGEAVTGASAPFNFNPDVLRNTVNYGVPNTVFVVARYSSADTSRRGRIISGTANDWTLGWYQNTLDRFLAVGTVNTPSPAIPGDTVWRIYAGDHSNADVQRIFRNNVILNSNSAGSAGPSGITLGLYGPQFQQNNSQERSAAEIAEVIIYNRVLSDAERAAVFNYLNDRYGVY